MTKYFKDQGNRSVSDEQIAIEWIKANPEAAAKAMGRAPLAPRPFAVQTKTLPDGRVKIQRADDDG
jgi:hypothetical protein